MAHDVVILGIFVADTTYRAARMPVMGETLIGEDFHLTPGGKGSNQAVAAAKAGAATHLITKLGQDDFAQMAQAIWQDAGVVAEVITDATSYTGAAFVFIDSHTGNNAIIVSPGVAGTFSPADIDAYAPLISSANIFLTQLEQPQEAAFHALKIAKQAGVTTLLNPAPAAPLADGMMALCDYVTPNETEATSLTGIEVTDIPSATSAAEKLLEMGAKNALITLGEQGVLLHNAKKTVHIPAISAGKIAETTGAGDAFNGGFATALSEGADPEEAAWFGTATAAIAVTRAGTAASMPDRSEISALLLRARG